MREERRRSEIWTEPSGWWGDEIENLSHHNTNRSSQWTSPTYLQSPRYSDRVQDMPDTIQGIAGRQGCFTSPADAWTDPLGAQLVKAEIDQIGHATRTYDWFTPGISHTLLLTHLCYELNF
jgi:hypothetical protein